MNQPSAPLPEALGFSTVWFNLPEVRLHAAAAGPEDGPLLILLHGFPEFWYGWAKQMEYFASAGYRVIAPDQRGYNLSDKPEDIGAYGVDALAADVVDLIGVLGREQAIIAGHDWGAAVAWWTAIRYPMRLEKMVIVNVPHFSVMSRHLRRSPRQLLRSWYILFFQLPLLPEFLARAWNWRMLECAVRGSSNPGAFSDLDIDRCRQAWSQPGALTAMVNWYRAARRQGPEMPEDPRISVPTLIIWGARDAFLGREMAQPSADMCHNGKLVFFEDATHWVLHEEPDEVNRLMDEFFSA